MSTLRPPARRPDHDRDHWPRHARGWSLLGPPLRPWAEDVAVMQRIVDERGAAMGAAVVLGVTPELVGLRWPAAARVVAVERSAAVIAALYRVPGRAPGPAPGPGGVAVQADWRALPCADGALGLVVGDGSLSNLAFPEGYRTLAAELRRALRPDGRVALRLFAAPEVPEPLAAVAADLHAGRIGSVHVLKWRLAMAVQPASRNVAVVDIRGAFDAVVPDRAALAARTGWPPEVVATIDVYRASDLVYSFPTRAEACAALDDALVVDAVHTPGYELGARCPTIVLRPR